MGNDYCSAIGEKTISNILVNLSDNSDASYNYNYNYNIYMRLQLEALLWFCAAAIEVTAGIS